MNRIQQQLNQADRYSNFVGLMRWVLPAGAALLLVLLFVWPSTVSVRSSLPPDTSGLREIINLTYRGFNKEDEPFTVTATRAVQEGTLEDVIQLTDVTARLERSGGGWVSLTAKAGAYTQKLNQVQLTGHVHLTDDQGYDVITEQADINLTTPAQAWGDKPVNGQGPKGNVKAQGFRITDEGKTVMFTGRARMELPPGNSQGK